MTRGQPYVQEGEFLEIDSPRWLDAEDLVHETFLRAWRSLQGFEGRVSFRNWLYRIATNACLNALASRARARRVLPETQGPPSDQMPDAGAGVAGGHRDGHFMISSANGNPSGSLRSGDANAGDPA